MFVDLLLWVGGYVSLHLHSWFWVFWGAASGFGFLVLIVLDLKLCLRGTDLHRCCFWLKCFGDLGDGYPCSTLGLDLLWF